jgi:hypothetical protein
MRANDYRNATESTVYDDAMQSARPTTDQSQNFDPGCSEKCQASRTTARMFLGILKLDGRRTAA